MIDEYYTWIIFGYHSYELSCGSGKPVVNVCDDCYRYATRPYRDCHDYCYPCSTKHRPPHTEDTKLKMSETATGITRNFSNAPYLKMSEAGRKYRHSPKSKLKISEANMGHKTSDETRRKLSAWHQGIDVEDWERFVANGEYCEKFDEACRERIRAKYDYKCFLCDKPQDENITKNGKMIKLAVHHVDMNKDQGCNGNEWKLVPLCLHCHFGAHRNPMKSRLVYLIDNE